MPGKQAKLLTTSMVRAVMTHVRKKRYPVRDLTMILLSVKAGLRAGEIANLTWGMVLDARCKVSDVIALHDRAAKKLSGRIGQPPILGPAFNSLFRQVLWMKDGAVA
jgi:integrase/recombinase XerD